MTDSIGAGVRDWTLVVRRAQLGRTTKAVAILLATYADSDGTRVRPGIARIAIELEIGYNTAKAAMAELRTAGLIECVHKATRRGESDEYRLIMAADLLDRIEVWSPGQVSVAIERTKAQKRGKHRSKGGPEPVDLQPTERAADEGDLRPAEQAADEEPAARLLDGNQAPAARLSDTCGPPGAPPPTTDLVTTATDHSDNGLRTAAHGPRANPAEPSKTTRSCRCTKGYVLDGDTLVRCPTCHPPDTQETP